MTVRVVVEGYGSWPACPGVTLLEVCEAGGVPIAAECGGFAACNSCRVAVLEGQGLSPTAPEEEPFLERDDQRLACQARIVASVRVRLDPGL